jgi:hypothetical protein
VIRPRPRHALCSVGIVSSVSIAGIVAIVGMVLALAGCTGSSSGSSPSFGSGRGAPTLAQIADLLRRHAHAVTAKSATAFLADVDPGRAAAEFRTSQTGEIAALAGVPLRSWGYTVSSPVTDTSVAKAAAKRLGAPASIVHLTVSYALDPIDPAPIPHDVWWTFVQRHGHVYIAGDSDMAQLGGQSWHGPWDFGPIVTHRGTTSLVIGHPANAGQLAGISADVDAAVTAVSAVWGTDWNRDVAVIVPASAAEFTALGGTGSASGPGTTGSDISADTVFETTSTGGVTGRVLMNPAALGELTQIGRTIVIRHEVTHVATAASTPVGTPRWLVEGFAEYVANLGTGQPVATAAAELRAELRHGQVPQALPTDSDFASTTRLAAVYESAWLACRSVAARAGAAGLVRLYRLVGAGLDTASAAVTAGIHTVLHESVAAFIAQWRHDMVAELG